MELKFYSNNFYSNKDIIRTTYQRKYHVILRLFGKYKQTTGQSSILSLCNIGFTAKYKYCASSD